MTIIIQKAGIVPAANTLLPTWNSVFPRHIDPLKLKVGDDMLGTGSLFGSTPSWSTPAAPWGGENTFQRNVDGVSRNANANGVCSAIIESGVSEVRAICQLVGVTVGSGVPQAGVIIRASDTNNFIFAYCDIAAGLIRIGRRQTGSNTVLATGSVGYGVDPIIDIRGVGTAISVFVNGVLNVSATSSFNQTATRVGLYSGSQPSTSRYKNFMAGSTG